MEEIQEIEEIQETLQEEETVEVLVNKLIKKLKSEGKSIQYEDDKEFGSLTIWVFRLGTKDAHIEIEPNADSWKVKVKPTFKEF